MRIVMSFSPSSSRKKCAYCLPSWKLHNDLKFKFVEKWFYGILNLNMKTHFFMKFKFFMVNFTKKIFKFFKGTLLFIFKNYGINY